MFNTSFPVTLLNPTVLLNSTLPTIFTTTANMTRRTVGTEKKDIVLSVFTAAVCVIILLLGVLGNSLVLIVFGSRCGTLKSFEFYMVSLAAADLIGTFVLPSQKLLEQVGASFTDIGSSGCAAIYFMSTISIVISSFTLVVISIERYVAIKWPLRKKITKRTICLIIMGTWLLGMCIGVATYIEADGYWIVRTHAPGLEACTSNVSDDQLKIITATVFISESGLPLIIMSVLYGLITYELNKSSHLKIFQLRESVLRARHKRNKKTTKLLISIVVVFFICTMPKQLFYVLYVYDEHLLPSDVFIHVNTCLSMLWMSNSCVNPLIYSKLHTAFRRRTLRLFCSCCMHKQLRSETVRESLHSAFTNSIYYASSFFSRSSRSSSLFGPNLHELEQCSSGVVRDRCGVMSDRGGFMSEYYGVMRDRYFAKGSCCRVMRDSGTQGLQQYHKKCNVASEEHIVHRKTFATVSISPNISEDPSVDAVMMTLAKRSSLQEEHTQTLEAALPLLAEDTQLTQITSI